jgi:hypothetical protein
MELQYHILNGDSLKNLFPKEIKGELIVARECLVDGNVGGKDLAELYSNRVKFLDDNYGNCSEAEYFQKSISEFRKVQNIPPGSYVNLWFEDDLFCQVNLWFVLWLLQQYVNGVSLFLVRPKVHNQYGFAGLSREDLISIYKDKLQLEDMFKLSSLWKYYQIDKVKDLLKISSGLSEKYPFILPAVKAHIDRIPKKNFLGRPKESLIQIMKDLGTNEFGPVFREFSQRESIYGYGDLQVKRLLKEIKI